MVFFLKDNKNWMSLMSLFVKGDVLGHISIKTESTFGIGENDVRGTSSNFLIENLYWDNMEIAL